MKGYRYPSSSVNAGEAETGRHLRLSHSLVRVRWIPTSRSGFSSSRRTASGNHGEGTSTSMEVWIPSREHLMSASLPASENPISSPLTLSLGPLPRCAHELMVVAISNANTIKYAFTMVRFKVKSTKYVLCGNHHPELTRILSFLRAGQKAKT